MSRLILLVGIPASGKTTYAREWAAAHDAVHLLDSDMPEQEVADAMKTGRPVILDATHRTPKYRKPYVDLAKRCGYAAEAVLFNRPLEQVRTYMNQRLEKRLGEGQLRKFERNLQIPTFAEGFDQIRVVTDEEVIPEAAAFLREHEGRLLREPTQLIREWEEDGRLLAWIPELHSAIPVDQHNPHHRFTVYEHIMKATETAARSSLKMVWTMLLHDIGKAYPGIKQFTGTMLEDDGPLRKRERVIIENGADIREGRDDGDFYRVRGRKVPKGKIATSLSGHFYEHENIGAQLAYRVLRRLGYEHGFAYEVATLIQFHMLMPRGIEEVDVKQIHKFYEKVGPYAADLMMVRLADNRGK